MVLLRTAGFVLDCAPKSRANAKTSSFGLVNACAAMFHLLLSGWISSLGKAVHVAMGL